jgi:uncharacterized protein
MDRMTDAPGVGGSAAPVRVVLRPIGHPLPLGFVGLAAATFVVSGLQLGWFSKSETPNVALVLIAFVFPVQLIASVFGYLSRDTVAGTSMGILAGTWLAVGLVLRDSVPGSTTKALGVFLVVAGVAMLIPALGAFAGKVVAGVVLAATALRFVVTGIYQLNASTWWKTAAGDVGVVLGVFALYAAFAIAFEDVFGRPVLPTARHHEGRVATNGSFDEQLAGIEHDAGVRQQL